MTPRLTLILSMLLVTGCTPDLGNSPPDPGDDPVGDDDDAAAPTVLCYTIGEDFWNDGYYVYRLDVDDATAEVFAGPLDDDLYVDPSLAVVGDQLYGIDQYTQRFLTVDLGTGQHNFLGFGLAPAQTARGLVDLNGGVHLAVSVPGAADELNAIDPLTGAATLEWQVDAGSMAYATEDTTLLGLDAAGTLRSWEMGASPQALSDLPLEDLDRAPSAVERVGDVVLVIAIDALYRFDAITGALAGGPLAIQAPGDAWSFTGLACVPED